MSWSASTLCIKPLNELFDNDNSSIEKQDDQRKIVNTQICFTHPKDIQSLENISNDISSNDNNDGITDEDEVAMTEEKNDRKIKGKNEVFKEKNENKLMRGTKESNKNSMLNIYQEKDFYILSKILEFKILGGGSYQTPLENLNKFKILGGESYQTSPESLNKLKILGGGSYQTPSENSNNPRIPDESFRTSLVNSTPID